MFYFFRQPTFFQFIQQTKHVESKLNPYQTWRLCSIRNWNPQNTFHVESFSWVSHAKFTFRFPYWIHPANTRNDFQQGATSRYPRWFNIKSTKYKWHLSIFNSHLWNYLETSCLYELCLADGNQCSILLRNTPMPNVSLYY